MENFIINHFELFILLLIVTTVWSAIWKGFALWKSARKSHKAWFIALLILNTLGVLEILYIFVFSKFGKKCSCHCNCHHEEKKEELK